MGWRLAIAAGMCLACTAYAAGRAADEPVPGVKQNGAIGGARNGAPDSRPNAAADAAAAKKPVPTPDVEAQALAQVKRVWGDQYARATTPAAKAAIAQRMLTQSRSAARRGSPDQYAALKVARDIAASAGDVATALAAVDALAAEFEIDALGMKKDLSERALAAAQSAAEKKAAAVLAVAIAEDAVAAEKFDVARSLLEKALAVAQEQRDVRLTQQLSLRRDEIDEVVRAAGLVAPARRVLADKPDDPAANLAVGRFLCFWKGDWAAGLPKLAVGSSASLKALAARELAANPTADVMAELADRWWTLAQENDGVSRKELQLHARGWYAKAAESALDGSQKARLQRRLSETDAIAATRLAVKTADAAKAKGKSAGGAKADAEPGKTGPRKRLVKKTRYESMLGVYLNDNKPTPMVNLSVPNGSSVLGDDVAAAMRGRVPFDKLSYRAVAHIEIPADGVYEFEQHFEKLWLNKREMSFNRNKGSVRLPRGVYEIQVQDAGASSMARAALRIKNKDSGDEVPVFNFGGEIEAFLGRSIGSWKPVEVSGWQPVEVKSDAN